MATGKDSQVGFIAETTYGTRVAPNEFVPFTSFDVAKARDLINDGAIIAGRRTLDSTQYEEGPTTVAGSLTVPLLRGNTLKTLFEHSFGGVSGLGTGASPWTFTPATLVGKSLSMQAGVGGTAGTVHPVDYTGVKVSSWSLAAQVGQIAEYSMDFVGRNHDTAQSLATASYTSGRRFSFVHGSVTAGGSARKVTSMTLSGDNGLQDARHFLGSALTSEQLEDSERDYTLELGVEFENMTDVTAFDAGLTSTITGVCTFTDGTNIIVATVKGFHDGNPLAPMSGRGPLDSSITLKAASTTDANAITVTMTNGA